MAFYGCQFSFNGIPCYEYGLMVYDIANPEEDGVFSSTADIMEDRTTWRSTPLHYGATFHEPLTFTFTFGADIKAIDKKESLDRWEMEAIASWLTGHDEYHYLEITQPDMELVRYKCIISDLEYTTYGKMPWAFKCSVICDSPYAYLYPEQSVYSVSRIATVDFQNRASTKYYYPKLAIKVTSGDSFSIINHSDNDRTMTFTKLPNSQIIITVDNENEVITNDKDLNLYDGFNYTFFRFVKGRNILEFKGYGIVTIDCEFPINVGG